MGGAGCGSFMARRLAQAPNTFPACAVPQAPVVLDLSPDLLAPFPQQHAAVGPPHAQLAFRLVEPGDYGTGVTSTHWVERGRRRSRFSVRARVPVAAGVSARVPRGTIVLLHGYGVNQVSMAPWALRLAEAGWRCLLVDLRGHGASTGKRIYFGVHEAWDLSQLLDVLEGRGCLARPVLAFGHSYGAAVALRWQAIDSRVHAAVAIAPYATLASAVGNIRRQYASWMPSALVRAGLRHLPRLLNSPPEELNPVTWLARGSGPRLLIAGGDDAIAPAGEVSRLHELALPDSRLVVVPGARHEPLVFQFEELVPPVLEWLERGWASREPPASRAGRR